MKKRELIEVIDKIVERKVREQMRKLKEEIFIDREESLSMDSIKEEFTKKPNRKKKKTIKYSKNESINKILNETKGGIPQNGTGEWPTMGGGTFDSSSVSELAFRTGPGTTDQNKREVGAVQTMKKAGVSVEQVQDHVQNALTKDYSKLMKAIDKKKGN